MKEIKLQVTPEQEKWLKHFAEHQKEGAKDNLGTRKPLHLVETRDQSIVFDNGESGNDEAYFDSKTGDHYFTIEEVLDAYRIKEFIPYDEALAEGLNGQIIWNEDDYLKAYGINTIQKVSIVYRYRSVSYHFTLESAREYIKYQGHNLRHPRTFTVAPGYGHKGDYEPLFDFLMAAGTSLLESEERFTNENYVDPEWGISERQV